MQPVSDIEEGAGEHWDMAFVSGDTKIDGC
jgi:hypothetical protein